MTELLTTRAYTIEIITMAETGYTWQVYGNVHSLTVGCALVTVVILYGHCGPPHGQGSWRGVPGISLGQGFTSSSTLTHLLGVSGAPTGTVGGAAAGRRSMRISSFGTPVRVGHGTRGFFAAAALNTTHWSPGTAVRV